jgi:hypothetical protein
MRSRFRHHRRTTPLLAPAPANEVCLELEDHSTIRPSAIDFFQLRKLGDQQTVAARAARLTEQFITQNRSLMALLDVRVERDYDGRDVRLVIQSGNAVGAMPLVSPTTARPDYGLVVQPKVSVGGHRSDAGGDGLASKPYAASAASAAPLGTSSACVGTVFHDSGKTESAPRFSRSAV